MTRQCQSALLVGKAPADKARHDNMAELVDRMLELSKQKHSGKPAPSELDRLEREIAATDGEIDNLVFELYGVTDEERKIIKETRQGGSA